MDEFLEKLQSARGGGVTSESDMKKLISDKNRNFGHKLPENLQYIIPKRVKRGHSEFFQKNHKFFREQTKRKAGSFGGKSDEKIILF